MSRLGIARDRVTVHGTVMIRRNRRAVRSVNPSVDRWAPLSIDSRAREQAKAGSAVRVGLALALCPLLPRLGLNGGESACAVPCLRRP
jgi:hypothetical protein